MSQESRKLHRRKALKTARLVQANKGGAGIECRMSDLHSEGARLTFVGGVPETDGADIDLLFLPEMVAVRAKAVWSTATELGVRFKHPVEYLTKNDIRYGN